MDNQITWQWRHFNELSTAELHAAYCLRQQVFIIEQNCIYPDADNLDLHSWHLLGQGPDGVLQAYLRLAPPGLKFAEPSLGRVVTAPAARSLGLGHSLVAEGLRQSAALFPGQGNRIGAQAHLQGFYGRHGFQPVGEPYDEDGILHIDMLSPPQA